MCLQESVGLLWKVNVKAPPKEIQNPDLEQELETPSHRTITRKALCGHNSQHEQEKMTRQSKKAP